MENRNDLRWVSLLFAIALGGCATSLANLDKDGLKYSYYDLQIRFAENGNMNFINENWLIENWYVNPKEGIATRKRGDAFIGGVDEDLNEDGNIETSVQYYTELELRHKVNGSIIYVDMTLLPESKKHISVDVFLSNFVENISGSRSWFESSPYARSRGNSRVYAAKIAKKKGLLVAGHQAQLAAVELANLDQLRLDETFRSRTIEVLLLRIDDFAAYGTETTVEGYYPGLLSIVMSCRPEYFETTISDFYKLLTAIHINGQQAFIAQQ